MKTNVLKIVATATLAFAQMALAGQFDVMGVYRAAGNGGTYRVRVAHAAGSYVDDSYNDSMITDLLTPWEVTSYVSSHSVNGKAPDLWMVKRDKTAGRVEVHSLSGASYYKDFNLHSDSTREANRNPYLRYQLIRSLKYDHAEPALVEIFLSGSTAYVTIYEFNGRTYAATLVGEQYNIGDTTRLKDLIFVSWSKVDPNNFAAWQNRDIKRSLVKILAGQGMKSGEFSMYAPGVKTVTPIIQPSSFLCSQPDPGGFQRDCNENDFKFAIADYNSDGTPDLAILRFRHTLSNRVEVRVLSGRTVGAVKPFTALPLLNQTATSLETSDTGHLQLSLVQKDNIN